MNNIFDQTTNESFISTYFEKLEDRISAIESMPQNADAKGFFIQEVIRFYSIAGSLLSGGFTLDESANVSERYLTHVLLRSLLEPFFIILYIFDDPSQITARYEEQKNTFKDQYKKLMNDLNEPNWQKFMQKHGSKLEVADPTWVKTKKLPNVKEMLEKLKNDHNNSLDFLYPLYRITSFDTHGRSLGTIFESVFGKQCNFPILNLKYAIGLIANHYLSVFNDLEKEA